MPRHEDKSGASAWVRRWWRALVSEVCATALLVWLGIASAMPLTDADGLAQAPAPAVAAVALGFGCVVIGCCVGFGAASGAHMNPAVTLAAALAGRLPWAAAAAYALAQTLGAVLGFAALQATLTVQAPAGVTALGPGVGAAAGAAIEAALTGLLALACCGAWASPEPDAAAPLKIGLLVSGLVCAGGPATGASLNPARSFAPALLHNHWDDHWVYWMGPLAGAALAAMLHRHVLAPPPPPAPCTPAAPEELPLDDKV